MSAIFIGCKNKATHQILIFGTQRNTAVCTMKMIWTTSKHQPNVFDFWRKSTQTLPRVSSLTLTKERDTDSCKLKHASPNLQFPCAKFLHGIRRGAGGERDARATWESGRASGRARGNFMSESSVGETAALVPAPVRVHTRGRLVRWVA